MKLCSPSAIVYHRLPHVAPRDAIVLGAPVGVDVIIDTVLHCKLKECGRLAERLKNIDIHNTFYVLKNCSSLSTLMYTLRSVPCYDSQIINQYDDSVRSTLQAILNVTLTDKGLHQAKLPVEHGGIGVLSASDLALPAFLASVFISKTSTIIIDATWWHQRRQLQIFHGHMAVDHQDTNISFVDRCQSENMMSSSTGYRR